MCFGFVGKTFNLSKGAPKRLRHKRNENKHFTRVVLPQFRNRQIEAAVSGNGREGMFRKAQIQVNARQTVADSEREQMRKQLGNVVLSRNHASHNGNLLAQSSSSSSSLMNQGGGFRSNSSNQRRALNPRLSINRPDVRRALQDARRQTSQAARLGPSEGKGRKR